MLCVGTGHFPFVIQLETAQELEVAESDFNLPVNERMISHLTSFEGESIMAGIRMRQQFSDRYRDRHGLRTKVPRTNHWYVERIQQIRSNLELRASG